MILMKWSQNWTKCLQIKTLKTTLLLSCNINLIKLLSQNQTFNNSSKNPCKNKTLVNNLQLTKVSWFNHKFLHLPAMEFQTQAKIEKILRLLRYPATEIYTKKRSKKWRKCKRINLSFNQCRSSARWDLLTLKLINSFARNMTAWSIW